MLKNSIKLSYFVLIISFINLFLYHIPLFEFATNNLNSNSFDGVLTLFNLGVLALVLNALVLYIIFYLSPFVGKTLLILFAILNALAVYFINTYGVIIDKTMIGNLLNTNFEESSSFISFGLVVSLVLRGILPGILIYKVKITKVKIPRFFTQIGLTLLFLVAFIFVNSSKTLWMDKHSKTLGGLAMPWSYVINTNRFFYHKSLENKQEILLPNATVTDTNKSVVVLVIGESARSQNFSLYGYGKNTNPLLSKTSNVYSYKAQSCATYTTAGVKCILEHQETNELYEILPNYLFRNDIEVVWRTNNWGEPPIKIKNYQRREELAKICEGEGCAYDEILLSGLREQILASDKAKILIVLHTSTSHGPTYSKKYPPQFNTFMPICESVELGNCTSTELINAYDNTIVYTDYILSSLIDELKQLEEYKSCMLYVSDHGESLGENKLYMHGLPASIAPEEQLDIPFIVWLSDNSKELKPEKVLSQQHVFHSVLDFLSIESPIYDKNMSIFKE
jgi:lipid A ethanolaminephosphotransferase